MTAPARIRVLIGGVDVTADLEDGGTFSNVDPGGYEAAQFSFPQDPGVVRGQPVLVTLGLETAWAGRVQRVSRRLAGQSGVTVACEGHGGRFKDTLVQEIWRDIDLGRWGSAPAERLRDLAAGSGFTYFLPELAVAGDGDPQLKTAVRDAWPAGRQPHSEAWYDAEGIPIGSIYYEWINGVTVASGTTEWATELLASPTADFDSAYENTGDIFPSGTSGTFSLVGEEMIWAVVRLLWGVASAAGTVGTEYPVFWSHLAVTGRHSVPLRGTEPNAGFYASDLARDVLSRVSGVVAGEIQDSTFVVPHAVAMTPTEAERLIADWALLAGGWHWGTWAAPNVLDDTPALDFRPLPDRATCTTARPDLDALELEEDLSRLYDVCQVSYMQAGAQRTVTVSRPLPELADTDVGSRTLSADLGEGDADAAEEYGLLLLVLSESAGRASGSATTTAPVRVPGGGEKPACLLKAGIDKLRVSDVPNLPVLASGRDEFQLKRVEGTIGKGGVSTRLELGLGTDLQEVLSARLALAVQVATFGR